LALQKAQATCTTDPNEKHYDLISAIRNLRKILPVHVTFKHVKGHQDSSQTMVLTREAWMNIKMDLIAKQKVIVDGPKRQLHGMPYEGWVCSVEGNCMVKNLMTVLHTYLNGGPILHHWEVKQWFCNSIKDIDWDIWHQL